MNKKEIIKLLAEEKQKIDKLVKAIEKSDILSSNDSLLIRKQHGNYRFYIRESESSEPHYMGSNETDRIKALGSKLYATRLLKAAEAETSQLEKCLTILQSAQKEESYDKADIDEVFNHLNERIREMVKPTRFTDDGFAARWQAEKYHNRWMKSDYSFETPRGEKVRSKSEWMIASMLADAGVPYRYEEIVAISPQFGVFFHPDFTVLNKRTRKVYYWEHFGRMDDPQYVESSFMPKISEYYNFEFLPGEKLLMTFESKHSPLDTNQVKRLIENYLT